MYAAFFRFLPGPVWLRILFCLVLVAAVLAACVFWVFPFVNGFFAVPDVTVGE
jgi:hypothetical protein